ncbi:GNAT family N-acetyltransferase [Rhodopseudomonas sp. HC1]|uniref:GNAT family N-acetyltransferase n=1 Tax=Rhodopseudomonas infernalis TaxID=2897386 RepID=UPI001EE9667B|nr:GNAT family N-acetyltransferase [Rhodopseudomonas infernalis]MCG6204087.1 GNAT family N-acetyltransferase [Rhodopseudomonas infernalis]
MSRIASQLSLAAPGLTVRPMVAADDDFSRRLSATLLRAAFVNLMLPEPQLDALLALQFQAQQTGYRQCFPQGESFVIAEAGQAVGRVIVAIERLEANSGEEAEPSGCPSGSQSREALRVVDIALLPEAQCRGIGREVMTGLVIAARSLSLQGLTLSVAASNDRAREFYVRLGFVALGGEAFLQMMKPLPQHAARLRGSACA